MILKPANVNEVQVMIHKGTNHFGDTLALGKVKHFYN